MSTRRKTSNALAVIEPPKPKRVVGKAIETNPMIAAIATITPDKLDDIEQEIQATENYLAGLRVAHHVGSIALGRVPAAAPVQAEPVEEPGQDDKFDITVEIPAPPAEPVAEKKDKGGEGPNLSATLRTILTAHPDWTNDQVITEAQKLGVTAGVGSIRSNIYQVKSRLKLGEKKDKPAPRPAAEATEEKNEGESEGLPPKDSPFRAEAEQTLRKKIAEYIFKRGLVSSGDLIRDCKVSPRIVNDFMNHPWFESHMQKWRLTTVGKNEGLEDF